MIYDNIKSHKNQGFTLSLEDTFFDKPQGELKLTPPSRFRVKLIILLRFLDVLVVSELKKGNSKKEGRVTKIVSFALFPMQNVYLTTSQYLELFFLKN